MSRLWEEIHGAKVVGIRGVKARKYMAHYMSKYISKAVRGRFSYSSGWVWRGFCRSWNYLKALSRSSGQTFYELLTVWRKLVRMVVRPESAIGLLWIKLKWGLTYEQINQVSFMLFRV